MKNTSSIEMAEQLLSADKISANQLYRLVQENTAAFEQNLELIKRIVSVVPTVLTLCMDWIYNSELFQSAADGVESSNTKEGARRYTERYRAELMGYASNKETKDAVVKALKQFYPADEDKRNFILAHPYCVIEGGIYSSMPKSIKDDLDLWVQVYLKLESWVECPKALMKNQDFLRKCNDARTMPASMFNQYFAPRNIDDVMYAVTHNEIFAQNVPVEYMTREVIYYLIVGDVSNADKIEISLLSDENFVIGAMKYDINGWFYTKIDKTLRGDERIWRRWVDLCSLENVWTSVPQNVRESQAFVDYVLSLPVPKDKDGNVQEVKLQAVNCWFEEMFNANSELANRVVDLYARLIVADAVNSISKYHIQCYYIKNKDFWQAVDQRVQEL